MRMYFYSLFFPQCDVNDDEDDDAGDDDDFDDIQLLNIIKNKKTNFNDIHIG